MFKKREAPIVISIGGSLIVPNGGIDAKFLAKLNVFIRDQVKKERRFFLVTGGGSTARKYRDAGKGVIGDLTNEDLDWLGIHASRLNGHLLRTIFQDIAHPRIVDNYDRKLINWREPVVIGAGWKPGWSTDYNATLLARDYGARLIINLSNIDWVYDKDPNQFKSAKPVKRMTWDEMEQLVGTEWKPGMNTPFDPVATQLAKRHELTVIVANGANFKNLESMVEGESFKGTIICPFKIDASYFDKDYFQGKKAGLRFLQRESWYASLWRRFRDYCRAVLIKSALKPKKCLDVGCGRGELVRALRSVGIDAYGIDVSEYALDIAHPDVKPYLRKADVLRLPYADDDFDLVVSFGLLEHIEQGKVKRAINESVRVAKSYILHSIFTTENSLRRIVYTHDPSQLSLFARAYWERAFKRHDQVQLLPNSTLRFASFFRKAFLLKKTTPQS